MSTSKKAAGIGAKLSKIFNGFSNHVIIKTITAGMARLLPVIMVGSLITLLISIPWDPYTEFLASSGLSGYLAIGSTMTNDLISIYLVAALSFEMARILKKSQISSVLISLMSFFILTPLTVVEINEKATSLFSLANFGSRGMFVGIIVALCATYLFAIFTDKLPKIKMPASVPPAISGSFNALFPAMAVGLVFITVNGLFTHFVPLGYANVFDIIYGILQEPLMGLGDSIWTMLLICMIGEFLWFFGIHGSNVTSAITYTLWLPPLMENASVVAAGGVASNILNASFLNVFKGPRHFVLAAMLLWFARSKQLKAIGKVAIVPGVFGISEPMKFGVPMVLNLTILVPMVVAPMMSVAIAYVASVIGFMPVVSVNLPWAMPPVISGFMAAGWQGAVVQIIQAAAIFALYIPFFKILDRQKIVEEEVIEEKSVA